MRAVNLLPRDLERQGGDGRGRLPSSSQPAASPRPPWRRRALHVASGSVSDQRAQLDSVEAAIARRPDAGPAGRRSGGDRTGAGGPRGCTLRRTLDARSARPPPPRARVRAARGRLAHRAHRRSARGSGTRARRLPGAGARRASSAQGVTIQGATYSNASVARVLARLAATPLARAGPAHGERARRAAVRRRRLESSKPKTKKKQRTIVTFTIAANLRSGRVVKARFAALPLRAQVAIAIGAVLVYCAVAVVPSRRAEALRGGERLRGRHRGCSSSSRTRS